MGKQKIILLLTCLIAWTGLALGQTKSVSGTVVEVNEALEDQPELVNEDAYENWIIKVELSDKAELDNLMDAKAYEEFCAK